MKKVQKKTIIRIAIFVVLLLAAFFVGYLLPGTSSETQEPSSSAAEEEVDEEEVEVWTCSMHPQIKLPEPGQCPICHMDLIPLESDDEEGAGMRELTVTENAAKLMEINTAPVERKFVASNVRMVGKIDYDETRVSYITAWIPGRLDRLFVDYTGVSVKKGDHMVYLYSPELLSAQEELLQALETVENLERSSVEVMRETAQATVEAVRAKLRLWGLTSEQIEEIEERGTADEHMTIYAPEGGIVIHKNAQEGMYVDTGTRIYTIADLSQVWVNLDAYESDLAWLKYGQKVEFRAEAYPGETFTGTISFIDPVLNEDTRTVKVRLNVPNEDRHLKPGMFVRATAEARVATAGRVMDPSLAGKWICPMHPSIVKEGSGACDICEMALVPSESLGYVEADPDDADRPLVIPDSAPLLTGKRAVVYVEVPDKEKPTYEGREIVLGPRAGDYFLVERGLEEGERVVTQGNFKLDSELQIQAQPSMMTPESSAEAATEGEISAVAKSQLREVLAMANAAIEASAGQDLERAQEAYGELRESVNAVDAGQIEGQSSILWNEYRMLFGNDATVGAAAESLAVAKRLRDTTREHLQAMREDLRVDQSEEESEETPQTNPEFLQQLDPVVAHYLEIQTALAEDDSDVAAGAAQDALAALGEVDMKLVEGDAHENWMANADALKSSFSTIAESSKLETQRKEFSLLSEEMISVVKRFGVPDGKLYQVWCAMAFDNDGAAWLQDQEEIENPYYGDAMLKCGEIEKVLGGE